MEAKRRWPYKNKNEYDGKRIEKEFPRNSIGLMIVNGENLNWLLHHWEK
jgi:hypothetical protein